MTTPVFLASDETTCDDGRALTAEHGRRIVRNALAVWNERCGHVGMAEQLIAPDGSALSTRVLISAGWAYVGPWHYFCPSPVGTPNAARTQPFVRLLLTGRATGSATSYIYAVNETLGAPSESQMDSDVSGAGDAWAEITTADWSATLTLRITTGWNRIWLAVKCGLYGTPVSMNYVDGETTYNPYLAEYVSFFNTAGSHPAVLAPQGSDAAVYPKAVLLSPTQTDYDAGRFEVYTVPLVEQNTITSDALDGMWLLWEPFRADLSRVGPVQSSSLPGWLNPAPNTYPVIGYTQDIDVLNLDSVAVDGSQVWETEDYADGAGLRWWQLPSAGQYRNAANLAEIARRSVCPMVALVTEVNRGTSLAPYPLVNDAKPKQWNTSGAIGFFQSALLSISEDVPFAMPEAEVNIELKVSAVLLALRSGLRSGSVPVTGTIELFNRITLATIATSTRELFLPILPVGAGSLDGFSVLARTLGWSEADAYIEDQRTKYGQEGLTLRADWPRWTDTVLTIAVPRASIPTDPVLLRYRLNANGIANTDAVLSVGSAGIRIKGA